MLPKCVQVIKRNQVEVSGSVCLSPSGSLLIRGSEPAGKSAVLCGTPQQARVIESNSEYAIIEVICSCSGKSYIQCNYAHLSERS